MQRESGAKRAESYNIRSDKYRDTHNCVSNLNENDTARFWAKVKKTPTCWLWRGAVISQNGYGGFSMARSLPRGKQSPQYAHRIAWALSHGPIPAGQSVLHACDVPLCCNPAHLFLGTQADNMRDAAEKGRLHVQRPAARKLTDAQRDDVRLRYAAGGVSMQALADAHGVTRAHIWQLVHRLSVEFTHPKGAA